MYLLIMLCMLLPHIGGQDISWSEVKMFNWAYPKTYYRNTDQMLLTMDSVLYRYSSVDSAWVTDLRFGASKIGNIYYSDKYEIASPSGILRNSENGDTATIKLLQQHEWFVAGFDNDTAVFVTPQHIYIYSINEAVVTRTIDVESTRENQIILYDGVLYTMKNQDMRIINTVTKSIREVWLPFGISPNIQSHFERFEDKLIIGGISVVIYDTRTDTDTILYIPEDPYETAIVDIRVSDSLVYTLRQTDNSESRTIAVSNINTRETVDLFVVNNEESTGTAVGGILAVEGDSMLLSDVAGGVFIFNVVSEEISWYGEGFYELTPSNVLISRNKLGVHSPAGLFLFDGISRWRSKSIHFPLRYYYQKLYLYRDSVIALEFSYPLTLSIEDSDGRALGINAIVDIAKQNDSTIYMISDRTAPYVGLYRYDGQMHEIDTCTRRKLVCSSQKVAAWSKNGELFIYRDDLKQKENYILDDCAGYTIISILDDANVVILKSDFELVAVDYASNLRIWSRKCSLHRAFEIIIHETDLLLLDTGQLLLARTGDVLDSIKSNVIGAAVFKNDIYVFYNHGLVIVGKVNGADAVEDPRKPNDTLNFDVFPNPSDSEVAIEVQSEVGCDRIYIMNTTGRILLSRPITPFENDSRRISLSLPDMPPAYYLLSLRMLDGRFANRLILLY